MDGLIGIVGDFNSKNQPHMATNRALQDIGLHFERGTYYRLGLGLCEAPCALSWLVDCTCQSLP